MKVSKKGRSGKGKAEDAGVKRNSGTKKIEEMQGSFYEIRGAEADKRTGGV